MREFSKECQPLVDRLAHVDPYFVGLSELRRTLSELFREFFGGQGS